MTSYASKHSNPCTDQIECLISTGVELSLVDQISRVEITSCRCIGQSEYLSWWQRQRQLAILNRHHGLLDKDRRVIAPPGMQRAKRRERACEKTTATPLIGLS